jgi:hypothetical protein
MLFCIGSIRAVSWSVVLRDIGGSPMRKRDPVSLVLPNVVQTHSPRQTNGWGAHTVKTFLCDFYAIVDGYPQEFQTLLHSLFRPR